MPTSDRWRAAGACLLLAACSDPGAQTADTNVLARVEADQRRAAEDDGRILCSKGGAALRRACTVDRTQEERGLILTVRHDDGGFHRLLVTTDGRGVVAADGAEPARVTLAEADAIDVAIGDDRYRLPATIGRAR
ncbi:MAG: hypothetical protein PGN08_12270 [Sphingomonas taxi]